MRPVPIDRRTSDTPEIADIVVRMSRGGGSPRSLRFRRGERISPFSVGRNGAWKIFGAGVEDVHVYVKFDGAALAMRSAQMVAPAHMDGAVLSDQWTEVRAPTIVRLGELCLLVDSEQQSEDPAPPPGSSGAASHEPADVELLTRVVTPDYGRIAALMGREPPADVPTRVVDMPSLAALPARSPLPSPNRPPRPSLSQSGPPSVSLSPVHHATPSSPLPPPTIEQPAATDETASAPSKRRLSPPIRVALVLLPLAAALLVFQFWAESKGTSAMGAAIEAAPIVADSAQAIAPPAPVVAPASPVPSATAAGSSSARTAERQAADAVAHGDYGVAVGLYRTLADAHPESRAFGEAARILSSGSTSRGGARR